MENRKALRARREAAAAAGHEQALYIPGEAAGAVVVRATGSAHGDSGAGLGANMEDEDDEGISGPGVAYAAERRMLRERITGLEDKLQASRQI